MKTDKEFADEVRAAIAKVRDLMNEGVARKITIDFSIPATNDMRTKPPTTTFLEIVTIRRIEIEDL